MYLNFFGLTKEPFKITPDPSFFFSGSNRGAVLEALRYAIARGEGIVKVVGEVGSGKTMLCRMLERELPENCEIIYLDNPRLDADEILHAIAYELRLPVEVSASKLEVLSCLQRHLVEKHANNRRIVMFIEEAQGMTVDTLEEVRMLSNLETTQEKLLQIVLFGQPELNDKLARHEIRQLRERITYTFDLAALNKADVRDYIHTRLRASGFRGNALFTDSAVRVLTRYSKGLLRRINVLSDKAMLAAFSRGERVVGPKHVRLAARDSGFASGTRLTQRWAFGLGFVVVLGALTVWSTQQMAFDGWFFDRTGPLAGVESTPEMLRATVEAESAVPLDGSSQRQIQTIDLRQTPAKLQEILPIVGKRAANGSNRIDPNVLLSDFIAFEAIEVDTSPVMGLAVPLVRN